MTKGQKTLPQPPYHLIPCYDTVSPIYGQGGCLSTSWWEIAGQAPIYTQYIFPYGDNTHSAPTTCA
ncbi:MAG: hypothetical protein ACRC3G_01525 [Bacteroidales bacterium]